MRSSPLKILRPQVKRLKRSQILLAQAGELVQQLVQRLTFALIELLKAVERIEGTCFAILQNDPSPWHPVRSLTGDQMADNVKGAPCVLPLIMLHPGVGKTAQQRVEG